MSPETPTLRELIERATGLPWRLNGHYLDSPDRPPPVAPSYKIYATDPGGDFYDLAKSNAALIVAAVNALPAHLDLIEQQQARIAELEAGLLRPINMQEVRLCVGEGKLTAGDVLAGCNLELRRRCRARNLIAKDQDQ